MEGSNTANTAETFTASIRDSTSKIQSYKPSSDTSNIWELTLEQINILSKYYAQTLDQVNKGFWLAVGFAVIGLVVFALAAISILKGESASSSLIAGTFVEGLSGLGFYLHGKSLPAMENNSKQIDRMQRYLFAFALSEKLKDRDIALLDLIKAIASEK